MSEFDYKLWMWVVKMSNFQKLPKSTKNEFSKMCEKTLDFAKDNANKIKQDKI